METQEIGIHGKRESSEGPEYPEKGGPRRDRNTQGEMALRETGIHRERWPSERPEYTGRVCPRRDRKQETTM